MIYVTISSFIPAVLNNKIENVLFPRTKAAGCKLSKVRLCADSSKILGLPPVLHDVLRLIDNELHVAYQLYPL